MITLPAILQTVFGNVNASELAALVAQRVDCPARVLLPGESFHHYDSLGDWICLGGFHDEAFYVGTLLHIDDASCELQMTCDPQGSPTLAALDCSLWRPGYDIVVTARSYNLVMTLDEKYSDDYMMFLEMPSWQPMLLVVTRASSKFPGRRTYKLKYRGPRDTVLWTEIRRNTLDGILRLIARKYDAVKRSN